MYPEKIRSRAWYLVPIFFGLIGGIIAYFAIRRDDPQKAKKCLWVGIILTVINIIVNISLFSTGTFEQDYTVIRQPPSFVLDKGIQSFWTESHFLGTDRTGRDLFTRILWGIQNTLILTVIGMVTGGLVVGVTMGLIAGYFEKSVDALIMRTGEIFALIPTFFLVLIIAATLRPRILMWIRWLEDNTFFEGLVRSGVTDYIVISLSLVIFSWFGTARLIRGQILYLKCAQYIDAATAIGASTKRILFKHLLPNSISTLIVTVTMGMGTMVGVEIFLSWIGLGIQPPRPSLGVLLWEGGHISVLR